MHRMLPVIGAAIALSWGTAGTFAQPRPFELDDLARLVRLSDPQIAPDGKTVGPAGIQAVSRAEGQRRRDEVRGLSNPRPQRRRPAAPA